MIYSLFSVFTPYLEWENKKRGVPTSQRTMLSYKRFLQCPQMNRFATGNILCAISPSR